jgi:uncharacterized Rmd1/YagE family protein
MPGAVARKSAYQGETRRLVAHAVLLGERLNTAGLEHDGVVAAAPLTLRVGAGFAVVFRYGVVVFFGLAPQEEAATLRRLSERLLGPEPAPEDETAQIVIEPDQEDQVTAAGAIQLREPTPEHLLIIADALAKSVALAHDERQVAAVFDALEPFAAGLAARGRSPGGRTAILRMIGRALLVQHRVSGRVAVREKPDILWERPDLERLYGRLEDEYELVERAETLDRKIAFIAASAEALVELNDSERSMRLELVIVVLILVEVALALGQLFGFGRR